MSERETEYRNTGSGGTTGSESGRTTGAGGTTGNDEIGTPGGEEAPPSAGDADAGARPPEGD